MLEAWLTTAASKTKRPVQPGPLVFAGALFWFVACLCSCGGRLDTTPSVEPMPEAGSGGPSQGADASVASGPVVLFGGFDNSISVNADTWEWDGAQWTQRNVSGPSARYGHAMASLPGRIVLFGGRTSGSANTVVGDTWEWDGTAWTQLNISGPSARYGHAMATLNGHVVLFGGNPAGTNTLGDTWEFDGSSWTEKSASGPSARRFASMASLGNTVILYGGEDASGALADAWLWNGSTWTQIATQPPTSSQFPSAFVPASGTATLGGNVILLGAPQSFQASETWEYSGTSWQKLSTTAPSARFSYGMTTFNDTVFIFGGDQASLVALGETWRFDGQTWTQLMTASAPSARYGLAMATFEPILPADAGGD